MEKFCTDEIFFSVDKLNLIAVFRYSCLSRSLRSHVTRSVRFVLLFDVVGYCCLPHFTLNAHNLMNDAKSLKIFTSMLLQHRTTTQIQKDMKRKYSILSHSVRVSIFFWQTDLYWEQNKSLQPLVVVCVYVSFSFDVPAKNIIR